MSLETGGSPVAGYLSCAAKKGNPKKAAPGAAPLIQGVSLCCPTRQGRLRNSTWQGTHNVPCHGTRTVLAENPLVESNCTAQSQGETQKAKSVLSISPAIGSCFGLLLPRFIRFCSVWRQHM